MFFFWLKENTIPYRTHFDPHISEFKGYDLQVYFFPGKGVVEAVSWGDSTPFWRDQRVEARRAKPCGEWWRKPIGEDS